MSSSLESSGSSSLGWSEPCFSGGGGSPAAGTGAGVGFPPGGRRGNGALRGTAMAFDGSMRRDAAGRGVHKI